MSVKTSEENSKDFGRFNSIVNDLQEGMRTVRGCGHAAIDTFVRNMFQGESGFPVIRHEFPPKQTVHKVVRSGNLNVLFFLNQGSVAQVFYDIKEVS